MLFELSFFLLLSAVVFGHDHSYEHSDEFDVHDEYNYVTCGSVIKLINKVAHRRLHSHKVSYGNSGSGQQSVTAVSDRDDTNSLWSVLWTPEHPCAAGEQVKNGQTIRLRHVNTQTNLHSHLHQSPLSQNQEVSAFAGNGEEGDSGDNWKVVLEEGAEVWRRGDPVRLQHVDTGKWLETNSRYKFGNPIPGQLEVYCTGRESRNNQWVTEDGIYFAIREN